MGRSGEIVWSQECVSNSRVFIDLCSRLSFARMGSGLTKGIDVELLLDTDAHKGSVHSFMVLVPVSIQSLAERQGQRNILK